MGRTDYEKEGAKCWELKKHTMFYMLNDVMQDVCHVEILISEMSFYKISQGLNILHWQKWRFHWSTYSTQHKISFISLLYTLSTIVKKTRQHHITWVTASWACNKTPFYSVVWMLVFADKVCGGLCYFLS